MKIIGLLLAIAVVLTLAGCSEKPVSTIPAESFDVSARVIPPDVHRLFDQYALDMNAQSDGEPSRSGGFNADVSNTPYDAYVVTFIWGSLLNVATPAATLPVTDWSGSLTVNADGKINVAKPISFEAGQDFLLATFRYDPKVVGWVSLTSGDFDGMSFIILLGRATPAASATAITFATAPFTLRLTANQMAWFAAYYQISNTSGIAVLSQKLPPIITCPSGLMVGHWVKANVTGDRGTFNGLWLKSNGDTTGVFSGMFWTENDGRRLFSGNVSGVVTTQIIAYLNGKWYYEDPRMCPLCGAGFGRFSGYFRYPGHNDNDGILQGQFGSLTLPANQLDLPLTGSWTVLCYRPTNELRVDDK
ncbi:MAG: hypothetical protein NT028_09245 [candidate division Zixibacteria bacterium]|nr:hypothetical protein [candidate division Zixibacteria bacterium]